MARSTPAQKARGEARATSRPGAGSTAAAHRARTARTAASCRASSGSALIVSGPPDAAALPPASAAPAAPVASAADATASGPEPPNPAPPGPAPPTRAGTSARLSAPATSVAAGPATTTAPSPALRASTVAASATGWTARSGNAATTRAPGTCPSRSRTAGSGTATRAGRTPTACRASGGVRQSRRAVLALGPADRQADRVAGRLDSLDLSKRLSRQQEAERLAAAQTRLVWLRLSLGGQVPADGKKPRLGPPVCAVFEGWDASGKGGCIKRLVAPLDPRHVRVASFAAPTYDEKRHHFLWRFWPTLPGWGGMAVLDRSWYGRVLVERVEGFATEEQWQRAYQEICEFERTLVDEGTILVKFWLHLSDQEQLHRFERRQLNPLKQWKLTDEDWRNRDKRQVYEAAVEQILDRTDTSYAPWLLVEADSKRWARVKVVESVIAAVEDGLRSRGLEVPPQPAGLEDKLHV